MYGAGRVQRKRKRVREERNDDSFSEESDDEAGPSKRTKSVASAFILDDTSVSRKDKRSDSVYKTHPLPKPIARFKVRKIPIGRFETKEEILQTRKDIADCLRQFKRKYRGGDSPRSPEPAAHLSDDSFINDDPIDDERPTTDEDLLDEEDE